MDALRRSVVAALLVLASAAAAHAQYFGRNKVQYRDFDFKVLKTQNFDVYYYPEEQQAAEQAGRLAERWYARLGRMLDHRFTRRQPLILYASHPHFEQTNVLQGEIGEGTGGVTEAFKRRIIMPLAGPLAETDHVLGHELVHAFQFDITGQGRAGSPGALRLPLWFIEGMAEYLSIGPVDAHTAMWIRDAAHRGKLPEIKKMDDPRFFPYRYGQALWAYVASRYGDDAIAQILRESGRGNWEQAFEEVLGVKVDALSKEWHEALLRSYKPLFEAKYPASRYAQPLITEKTGGGDLNVGPALSPDGSRIVFLSEKDLFSIDMYLADARTGRITRRIVKTAVDPHFESLQFINSAGGFDPSGRRFAFAAVSKGVPVLTILDVDQARIEREIPLPGVGEIFDPSFAPDGNQVVFSALVGGLSDLFIYDLRAGSLRRLTEDAFADLQPAFAPDGRSIAFVSDRFSTELASLDTGNYRLALMDTASGDIRPLRSFKRGKNIDPQWAPDGRSVYFLSDESGITNIYRLDLTDDRTVQVTDLLTGVSGITALSPSLSIGGGRLAFSVYQEGKHAIFATDTLGLRPTEVVEVAPASTESATVATDMGAPVLPPVLENPAALAPGARREAEVVTLKDNARFGLPEARNFRRDEYKPKLSLDYVGQPYIGVGHDPLGTFVGGGASFLFSDMLGNHNLGAVVQLNGQLKDFGGVIGYENREHRFAWGAVLEQIPYVSGAFGSGLATLDGQDVIVEQSDLFRQTNRSASAFVAYPFSRVQRVELSGAVRNIGYSRELQTRAFSLFNGQLILDETEKLPAPEGVTFGEAAAALVYDSSVFGVASPILGQRYRFEASHTVGDIAFAGLLADYRRYVMPVRPITLAARLMHYGRYGRGSEDERLTPLYLGYPNLVRGYDVNSFNAEECPVDPDLACPVFDRLRGSKVLVGNVELRIPPFGALGGRGIYGPLPLELVLFADGGVAWNASSNSPFRSGGRRPVYSVGAGARVNLLGFAIVEVDYVKPLDRPQKGWSWIFNFRPGF